MATYDYEDYYKMYNETREREREMERFRQEYDQTHTVAQSAAMIYGGFSGTGGFASAVQDDLSLNPEQKRVLENLISENKRIMAIKELRTWFPKLKLIDAKNYVDNLIEMVYNSSDNSENYNPYFEGELPETYDELRKVLIHKYEIDPSDLRIWEIIDLAFDVGVEEGETRGYKLRLEEERR